MNYSLVAQTENYSISKVIYKIHEAITAIKAELKNRGYNVTKLTLSGGSAGAHLASLYAYSRADESPLPIVLLINHVGPTDFHFDTWWGDGDEYSDEAIPAGADYIVFLQVQILQLIN